MYKIVTTFNKSGYDKYGKQMLESFVKYWPKDQQIIVYVENVDVDVKDDRIVVKDLLSIEDLVAFKTRNAHREVGNFKFDAVRFSHKVFALYDAVTNNDNNIVWMDADTITHTAIPDDFLETNFPAKNYGVTYLGRLEQYSECGFVVYHMENQLMNDFWETFINLYKNDTIYELDEWHDSYVFDVVRKVYEVRGMENHNLTPTYVRGHPFINCILGDYMDHLKGPRKDRGRSPKHERHLRTDQKVDWWNNEDISNK